MNRLRSANRDELAAALWPDGRDAGLSPLLSKLRLIVTLEGRGETRIVLPSDAWIDFEAGVEALHRAESAVAQSDWTAAYGPARVTQHVSMRGFFPGEELYWIEEVRRRLEGMHLRALELLAEACVHIGGAELDTGERTARRLIALEPYRESGHRFLMQIFDARGNRAEALKLYDTLRTLLRDELGIAPSPQTQQLHKALLGLGDRLGLEAESR
jgi:DNA-binding SARP family transcriptional activator